MAAFSDFNVVCVGPKELEETLQIAVKLGYDWLAVSTFVRELRGKGKKQKDQTVIDLPQKVPLSEQTCQLLKVEGRQFRQFSRLTALIDDPTNTHKLTSPEVQAYDLLAVQPTNEKTFQLACTSLEVDIISLNMTEKLPFYIKRPLVNLAIERGIHFEILYSPAVRDNSIRQNIISNALQLTMACKGKNIIISSGCEKAIELRGPYDITNLGLLFGLSSSQSKDAVSKSCRAVLKHAEARKIVKSVVSVVPVKSLDVTTKDNNLLQVLGKDPVEIVTKPPKKKKKI